MLKSPKEVARWLSIIPQPSLYKSGPLDFPWSWYWYTPTTALLAPKLVRLLLVEEIERLGSLDNFTASRILVYNSHLLEYSR